VDAKQEDVAKGSSPPRKIKGSRARRNVPQFGKLREQVTNLLYKKIKACGRNSKEETNQ